MIAYISGPYSTGDHEENVNRAIDVAEQVASAGHAVIVPHLSHYWDARHPHDWNFWMQQDLALLEVCDVLVRIPGESKGADMEVAEVKRQGIGVIMWDDKAMQLLEYIGS